jgi:glycosyltransferase involved in cell wall biosynthesis
MRFLKTDSAHLKNENGFRLLASYANATITESSDRNIWREEFDLVWIPKGFEHSLEFPNAKRILYGPHNFVFPQEPWLYQFNPEFTRSIYTSLSEYNLNIYSQFGKFCMPVESIPFPVDVEKFKPIDKKTYEYDCFLYFKGREPKYFTYIKGLLEEKGITYIAIEYGKYKQEDYITVLNKVKFGIWVGSHESQGFALQEALSMNVPLLVFNVKSLTDEVNSFGNRSYTEYESQYDLSATSCPYWDSRCGIVFTELSSIEIKLDEISSSYTEFNPRAYILETLSPRVCYERIISMFDL